MSKPRVASRATMTIEQGETIELPVKGQMQRLVLVVGCTFSAFQKFIESIGPKKGDVTYDLSEADKELGLSWARIGGYRYEFIREAEQMRGKRGKVIFLPGAEHMLEYDQILRYAPVCERGIK